MDVISIIDSDDDDGDDSSIVDRTGSAERGREGMSSILSLDSSSSDDDDALHSNQKALHQHSAIDTSIIDVDASMDLKDTNHDCGNDCRRSNGDCNV